MPVRKTDQPHQHAALTYGKLFCMNVRVTTWLPREKEQHVGLKTAYLFIFFKVTFLYPAERRLKYHGSSKKKKPMAERQEVESARAAPRLMYRLWTKRISHAVLLPRGLLYGRQEIGQFTLFTTKTEILVQGVHSAGLFLVLTASFIMARRALCDGANSRGTSKKLNNWHLIVQILARHCLLWYLVPLTQYQWLTNAAGSLRFQVSNHFSWKAPILNRFQSVFVLWSHSASFQLWQKQEATATGCP